MKRKNLLISVMASLAAATLVLIACGGGGGGGGNPGPTFTPPPANQLATINQSHGQGIAGSAMFGQQINNMMGLSQQITPMSARDAGSSVSATMLKVVMANIKTELMLDDAFQAAGSISDSGECDYGGSGSMSMNWDGPDAPVSSCSDASNLEGSLELNDCGFEQGASMNGTVSFSITGSLCRPTGMSMTYTNLSYSDSEVSLSVGSLALNVSNITWSGDLTSGGFMTSAQVVINGDATGSMDGESYAVAFDNYTQVISTNDDVTFTIELSGSLYGGCLDGWASITTLTPIEVNNNANCPNAGEIEISGDGTLNIVFNADGSVTMGDTDFPSCDALSNGCPM